MPTTAAFNLFCTDIDAQFAFYRALLGWDEDVASRSPIFRALRRDRLQFGLNARAAYDLLGLSDREPPVGAVAPISAYATFLLDGPAEVDRAVVGIAGLGGTVVKPGFATYYGQWQAVLADPERHVFRVASESLPPGVSAAPRPF